MKSLYVNKLRPHSANIAHICQRGHPSSVHPHQHILRENDFRKSSMDFKISLVLEAPSFSFLLKRKLDVSLQLVFNNEDLDVENDERMLVILSILILFVHCVEKIWKRMTFF